MLVEVDLSAIIADMEDGEGDGRGGGRGRHRHGGGGIVESFMDMVRYLCASHVLV